VELQLNKLRKRAGMSRKRLAGMLGVDESCVRLWEDGRADVTLSAACEISLALACTLDELVGQDAPIRDDPVARMLLDEIRTLDSRERAMVLEAVKGMVASLHTLPGRPTTSPPGVIARVA